MSLHYIKSNAMYQESLFAWRFNGDKYIYMWYKKTGQVAVMGKDTIKCKTKGEWISYIYDCENNKIKP